MEPAEQGGFLEVGRLLDASRPAPRVNLLLWMAGLLLLVVLGSTLAGNQFPFARNAVALLSLLAMAAMIGGMSAYSVYILGRYRAEQRQVEQIGEWVQLRRWPEAAVAVNQYLSSPSRNHGLRVQALVYLASVLGRWHRFDDAIAVQNRLLEEGMLDAGAESAVRVGRAMAMLREDHLFDADRAISELRRCPAAGSAGLFLVEIYRDVKTGHPAEAIELFEQKLTVLRDGLGHRLADVWALAARAYDLLGREAEAQKAFVNATLLAPAGELFRRYPEVEKLSGRYQPAPAPAEAA